MKASELIKQIQSQIDLYGDHDIEITTLTECYKRFVGIQYNLEGKIEIVINN